MPMFLSKRFVCIHTHDEYRLFVTTFCRWMLTYPLLLHILKDLPCCRLFSSSMERAHLWVIVNSSRLKEWFLYFRFVQFTKVMHDSCSTNSVPHCELFGESCCLFSRKQDKLQHRMPPETNRNERHNRWFCVLRIFVFRNSLFDVCIFYQRQTKACQTCTQSDYIFLFPFAVCLCACVHFLVLKRKYCVRPTMAHSSGSTPGRQYGAERGCLVCKRQRQCRQSTLLSMLVCYYNLKIFSMHFLQSRRQFQRVMSLFKLNSWIICDPRVKCKCVMAAKAGSAHSASGQLLSEGSLVDRPRN